MKNHFTAIICCSLAFLGGCRSAPEPSAGEMLQAGLEAYAAELKKAGPVTDARLQAAAEKLSHISFPASVINVCETIGIPSIWLTGIYSYTREANFTWQTYDLTENYIAKVKFLDNSEILHDMRIVRKSSPRDEGTQKSPHGTLEDSRP